MNPRPDRSTTAGVAYLDLRKLASDTGRPTDELHQLYVLEGFLDRLSQSEHADRFVLKGGVLLAAYSTRRPTRDIDVAASGVLGNNKTVHTLTNEILAIQVDDGLEFDLDATQVDLIREDEQYPNLRIKIKGALATAQIHFHIDVNIGDPIWPEPHQIELPRLLNTPPLHLRGYAVELILAEKIVTALQRGTANTRWRDFVDIANLATVDLDPATLSEAINRVAKHRQTKVQPLEHVLAGYANLAQDRWAGWRRKQQLTDTPENFSDLLEQVIAFSDPFLTTA